MELIERKQLTMFVRWTTTVIVLAVLCLHADQSGLAAMTGRIVVAGTGPELPVIMQLGKAFEKTHPGTAIDIEWDRNLKPLQRVKHGQADIAVAGTSDPELAATPVAWDGVVVVVNFANPVKEVTSEQLRGLFNGTIQRWSELDGSDMRVMALRRPTDQNLEAGFERILGLLTSGSARVIQSDEAALRAVSGSGAAITYLSLGTALEAQEQGTPIRILLVDKIDPAEPTVKDGRYKLRRPVLLLTRSQPGPMTQAFIAFVLSPDGQRILDSRFIRYQDGLEQTKPRETRQAERS
jgi:phosphate transport system substrate-binding protein